MRKSLHTLLFVLMFSGCAFFKNAKLCYTSQVVTEEQLKQRAEEFYRFKKEETVVSIGAEDCNNEAVYGMLTDSVNFFVENIDSAYLNKKVLNESIAYYEKKWNRKNNSHYTIVIGNVSGTQLPAAFADKIIIENTFHEFSLPEEMLNDCHRILKPDGTLFIAEILASPDHTLHSGCKKRLYFYTELNRFLSAADFSVTGMDTLQKCAECFSMVVAQKK